MTLQVAVLRSGKPVVGYLAETSCAALLSGEPVSLNKDTKIQFAEEKFDNAAVYYVIEGDPLAGEYVVISDHIPLR